MDTRMPQSLILAPSPTIRTWLLLKIVADQYGEPIPVSGRDINRIAKEIGIRISRGAAVKALRSLENLGIIESEPAGNIKLVRFAKASNEAA